MSFRYFWNSEAKPLVSWLNWYVELNYYLSVGEENFSQQKQDLPVRHEERCLVIDLTDHAFLRYFVQNWEPFYCANILWKVLQISKEAIAFFEGGIKSAWKLRSSNLFIFIFLVSGHSIPLFLIHGPILRFQIIKQLFQFLLVQKIALELIRLKEFLHLGWFIAQSLLVFLVEQ